MSQLFFVNPNPIYTEAEALGLSVAEDMLVLAFLDRNTLRNVQIFAHESGRAFRSCPYWPQWQKVVTLYGDNLDELLPRIIEDAIKGVGIVGFDPAQIKLRATAGNVFEVPKKSSLLDEVLTAMEENDFIGSFYTDPTDKEAKIKSTLLKFFWDSLRSKDGKKSWKQPIDRIDPIYALANGLAAIQLRDEASTRDLDKHIDEINDAFQEVVQRVDEAIQQGDDVTALEHLRSLRNESNEMLLIQDRAIPGTTPSSPRFVRSKEALRLLKAHDATLAQENVTCRY
jgi:hypothetical protein